MKLSVEKQGLKASRAKGGRIDSIHILFSLKLTKCFYIDKAASFVQGFCHTVVCLGLYWQDASVLLGLCDNLTQLI